MQLERRTTTLYMLNFFFIHSDHMFFEINYRITNLAQRYTHTHKNQLNVYFEYRKREVCVRDTNRYNCRVCKNNKWMKKEKKSRNVTNEQRKNGKLLHLPTLREKENMLVKRNHRRDTTSSKHTLLQVVFHFSLTFNWSNYMQLYIQLPLSFVSLIFLQSKRCKICFS